MQDISVLRLQSFVVYSVKLVMLEVLDDYEGQERNK